MSSRFNFAGRSFFSLYFLIISTFILFSWLVDNVWSKYLEQDVESYTGYKTLLIAVGDYVQKYPEFEWPELVKKTGERYQLPLSLIDLASFKAKKHHDENNLVSGSTHVFYSEDAVKLYYLIPKTQEVITLGPVAMPSKPRVKAIYRVMVLAFVGFIIFIWLWPVSKDLQHLKKAMGKFGKGDFNVTAPPAQSSMVVPMTRSFNMMSARIKRLIEAHKELTGAVSHELRTPLARSKFALQMLSSAKTDEQSAKYQQQITNDVHELEELINEMLIYASFDSDKPDLKFSCENINNLVKKQLANHEAFSSNIIFNEEKPNILAICDSHFIDRALNNYITNAIKYGAGQVRVSLSIIDEGIKKQKFCRICVEDNGEGVSEKFKHVIFDAFSRGDNSRNRETGGFGLGLAIVARIMEWHHGKALIEDSELGGAAFILQWPIE